MYFLVDVTGMTDPSLFGTAYDSRDERDAAALRLRKIQDDEDTIFWLDINEDGTPTIGAYTGHFFMEDN